MTTGRLRWCTLFTLAACAPALAVADELAQFADYQQAEDEGSQILLTQATRSSDRGGYRTAARSGRSSRVPYMIGDTVFSSGDSTFSALSFDGVPVSDSEFPIFAGGRANISENNNFLPADRLIFDYRHFHNATETAALLRTTALDVDRFLFGFEKTAFDGMVSAQLSVPLLRQLNSDTAIFDDGLTSVNAPPTDRSGELGNMAVTGKVLLIGRSNFAVAAGMAVNCPTAEDAQTTQYFVDPVVPIGDTGEATTTGTEIYLNGRFQNETVNLVPYIAWYWAPRSRLFTQGFVQIDTPLNRADADIFASGTIVPTGSYSSASFNEVAGGEIDQQTLFRMNIGGGYWIHEGSYDSVLRGIAALLELHYTATMDDANPFSVPLTTLTDGVNVVPVSVNAGQLVDDVEQVNLSTGVAIDMGGLLITNGVIVPVGDEEDRTFDFEYNCQAVKLF